MIPETRNILTSRNNYHRSLRLSIGSYKRIRLDPLATILIETFVEACERRSASIKRQPQSRAFSSYFEKVSSAQSLIERMIFKCDCCVFRFSQSLGLDRSRTCNKMNGIGFSPIELPFR